MMMSDKDLSEQIIQRLRELRIRCFGRRGRGKFAAILGISQSTYSYYERHRVPPVEILVRASKATGCSLNWLATGEGLAFEDDVPLEGVAVAGPEDHHGGDDVQEVVDRLVSVVGTSNKAMEAVKALTEVLQQARSEQREAAARDVRSDSPDSPMITRSDGTGSGSMVTVPVLGRAAAGIAMFWADRSESQDFMDLKNLAYRAIQAGKCSVIWKQSDRVDGALVELVQLPKTIAVGAVQVSELVVFPRGVDLAQKDLFAAWIDGDSMAPMLATGDLVVASSQVPASNGNVSLVQLNGQIGSTCKIYRQQGDTVHLTPANEAYATTIHPADQVIWALQVLYKIKLSK